MTEKIVQHFTDEVLKRLAGNILAELERQKHAMLWRVKKYIADNTAPEERNQTLNEWLGEAYITKNGETAYYFSNGGDDEVLGQILVDEFGGEILSRTLDDEIFREFGITKEEMGKAESEKNYLSSAYCQAYDDLIQFCAWETPISEFIMPNTAFSDQNENFFHLDFTQSLKSFLAE